MRVVFDTNVYIAAFVTDGVCARLLRRARSGEFELFLCNVIVREFSQKLKVKFRCTPQEIQQASNLITEAARTLQTEASLPSPVCREPDDDLVLACAEAASAEYLVTGDKDLLVLEQYGKCRILSPRDFELMFE